MIAGAIFPGNCGNMVISPRLRDTPSMETARRVTSDGELRAIAAAGGGFVVDPFNRQWHAAACPRILHMTAGQPKWFAATPSALKAYLQQRAARYATAKPILACRTCSGSAGVPRVVEPVPRPPRLRRAGSGFEVWADEYVPNEPRAASAAALLRRLISSEVRALPEPAGRVLHAGYAGQRPRGTDVENLLFNNIDQSLSLFSAPGRRGIRFEDLGPIVPPAPDGTLRPSFYSYRLAEPGEPFTAVEAGHLICHVPEAIVPDGPARLAARIWLAVHRMRPPHSCGAPPEDGDFLLRIAVRGLEPARSVKAIVDGATAAMQRDDPDRVRDAITRLSALLGVDAEELLALATANDAPWDRGHDQARHRKKTSSPSTTQTRYASRPTTTAASPPKWWLWGTTARRAWPSRCTRRSAERPAHVARHERTDLPRTTSRQTGRPASGRCGRDLRPCHPPVLGWLPAGGH